MPFLRLLPLVFLLSCPLLQAQTAEEIIEKYVAAIGGRARVDSLRAFVCSYEIEGKDGISYYQRPNLARNEISDGATGLIVCTSYDGAAGWSYSNRTGPQPFRLSERFPGVKDSDPVGQPFLSFLVDPVAQGFVVSLVGKVPVDATDCFELRLQHPKSEKEFHFFVDVSTFLIRRTSTFDSSQNPTETVFSDYQRFDGILFPMHQIITLTNQYGVNVTDAHFKKYKKIPRSDVRLFQCFPDVPEPKFD